MKLINMCKNSYTQIKEMTSFAYNNPREAVCNKKTALAVLALGILAGASYTVKNGYHKPFMQKIVTAYENTSIASKQKATVLGVGVLLGVKLYSQNKECKDLRKMLDLHETVEKRLKDHVNAHKNIKEIKTKIAKAKPGELEGLNAQLKAEQDGFTKSQKALEEARQAVNFFYMEHRATINQRNVSLPNP
ncbi:MAG: hypothetical protein ACOVOR_00480 [Rhabdochlamydiaceae bacterium]